MAKCVDLPHPPPVPPLPFPLTIAPTFPVVSFDAALCCKILPFPLVTPPFPLPPGTLNPAVVQAIVLSLTNAMQAIQNYIDALPLDCPFE